MPRPSPNPNPNPNPSPNPNLNPNLNPNPNPNQAHFGQVGQVRSVKIYAGGDGWPYP